jgi:hypothetical protein
MAISFKGAHFPQEVILMGVRWLCGQKTQMSFFPFIYGLPHLGFSS